MFLFNDKYDKNILKRNFGNQLLLNNKYHLQLKEQGFTHIHQIISKEEINQLKQIYSNLKQHNGFEHADFYINSIGFKDLAIKTTSKQLTDNILKSILERIYNTDRTFFPLGGGFAINPPNATKGCLPHQDPTFVDEKKDYALTTWLCLDDTTIENGCMMVIPKSHYWKNLYRSVILPWRFEDCSNELSKYLIPIEMKAGDILVFDVALIHASNANKTNQERLAMTIQSLPKNIQLMSYFPLGKYFIEAYNIDGNYFIEESQYLKPSKKYKKSNFLFKPKNYKPKDILAFISESNLF